MRAIKDVRLGHLEVALTHHLFLNSVLHILDVDEGLALPFRRSVTARAISTAGPESRCNREERPCARRSRSWTRSKAPLGRYDESNESIRGARSAASPLATTKDETLRDIVRIVLNQCFLDQKMHVVGRELERIALLDLSGQHLARRSPRYSRQTYGSPR